MTPGDSPTNSARVRMAETASGAALSEQWGRPLVAINREGAAIHPALLRAAAQTPLTPDANFDAAALRAILQQEAAPPAATPLTAKLPAPTPGASP